MVIAGTINRVAFYCRVNHRDRDYEKYLDDVLRRLEKDYGKQKWDLQIFFEEASGADPDRKEFHLCGWIFQLIALVSFDKGIIMPFDRMICSQQNTCTIRIIAL